MIYDDLANITNEKLTDFFELINDDFVPALSMKIEFITYIEKLRKAANVAVYITDENTIAGLVVYYTNLDIAQITLVATSPEYRMQRIAKKLLMHVIKRVPKPIKVITWKSNLKALSMYKKLGFKELSIKVNNYGIEESIMVRK